MYFYLHRNSVSPLSLNMYLMNWQIAVLTSVQDGRLSRNYSILFLSQVLRIFLKDILKLSNKWENQEEKFHELRGYEKSWKTQSCQICIKNGNHNST